MTNHKKDHTTHIIKHEKDLDPEGRIVGGRQMLDITITYNDTSLVHVRAPLSKLQDIVRSLEIATGRAIF